MLPLKSYLQLSAMEQAFLPKHMRREYNQCGPFCVYALIILRRHVKRPVCRKTDRPFLVLLARMARTWKQALFLFQPETLLRCHRELFRVFTEAHIQDAHEKTEALARDDCLDQRDGSTQPTRGEQSAFAVGSSS